MSYGAPCERGVGAADTMPLRDMEVSGLIPGVGEVELAPKEARRGRQRDRRRRRRKQLWGCLAGHGPWSLLSHYAGNRQICGPATARCDEGNILKQNCPRLWASFFIPELVVFLANVPFFV